MGTAPNQPRLASSTAAARPRQPRGTVVGGQFAPSTSAEPAVDLSIDEGIAATQRIAKSFISRYGLANRQVDGYMDEDDMTQDAVMAFLTAIPSDRLDEGAVSADMPIGVIAKRSIIRALDTASHRSKSSASRAHLAMKLLETEKETRERRIGRRLTEAEVGALASEVRESIPAKERPSEGYHRPPARRVSLDRALDASNDTENGDHVLFSSTKDEPEIDTREFQEGSLGDRAARLKDEGRQVQARAMAWDAIAESQGAPLVVTGYASRREIIRARSEVAELGGPLACAGQYLETGDTARALFLPFGDLDDDQKYAVCSMLRHFGDYADDLWRVAISQADGRAVRAG